MKIRFYLCLASICLAHAVQAQLTIDSFESGSKGWEAVVGYTDVRPNEHKTGINQSDYVLYTQRAVGDDNWAGAILRNVNRKGYKYLHAYMYRSNNGIPNLKVSDTNPQDLQPVSTIVAEQWQDVVFDISDYETAGVDFVFLMVDRVNSDELVYMLVDEVVLSNSSEPRTEIALPIEPQPGTEGETGTGETDGYRLVWADYFNNGTLDTDAWTIEVNGDGGGNNELQYYCERGVSVGTEPQSGKGCLILTATKENYNGKTCTSGRITGQGKVYFTHGKIEASIRFPHTADGLWPAFWMMGNDITSLGWPACGEIDIVEMGNVNGIKRGTQDRYFNGAYHWGTRWDDHRQYANDYTSSYGLQDDFHLFTVYWDNNAIRMYLDQDRYPDAQPYCSMTIPASTDKTAPGYYFHKPNYILFNLAVGGNFPSIWDINAISALAEGSASMYVDFVKVYQKGAADETFHGPGMADALESATTTMRCTIAPNPVTDWLNVSGKFSSLTIYALDGQPVLSSNQTTISVAHLSAGVYIVVVTLENGQTEQHKLIKQ
ncbi:MAG: family 16 glycosylhydrolase [Paludibacter sp.]|nr:family 16 glycosylhydrolase [Bacteroidales bacterium]MCM1069154.1 family 16 glycosylhydrolase [Prevotella sp.]MCM1353593.1 family 16 glycosylhydrolase [Bacteroides sp.]MCM1442754.1 family 16 glycosylhydrolase [Muribaculum sp.]MCM1481610.1 family 16 glycosylhydrolase [Paludibacter sp.]